MENKLWEFKVFVDKVNKYLLHIVKKNQRQNQNELTRDRRQGNGEKKEVTIMLILLAYALGR